MRGKATTQPNHPNTLHERGAQFFTTLNEHKGDGYFCVGRRSGAVLIWAMLVVMVLVILIGVMSTIVHTSSYGQKRSQAGNQAYYTANSVCDSITDWLNGTPKKGAVYITGWRDRQEFIDELMKAPGGVIERSYSESDLAPGGSGVTGSAKAEISINSGDPDVSRRNTIIRVRVTGFFAGGRETVTNTLQLEVNTSTVYQDSAMDAFGGGGPFDPDGAGTGYGGMERELNALPRDPAPVIVGNEYNTGAHSTMRKYNDNSADQATADAAITSEGSIRELTWRNRSPAQNTVLGTTHYPNILEAEDTQYDIRRFVTPMNGRWTINPLQTGGSQTTFPQENRPGAEDNSRLISLSMGDFGGRDVQIRFGGYNIKSGSDEWKHLTNGSNYYNSLLMFDFTDNAGSTVDNPYVEYYHNNVFSNGVSHQWHPQKWNSMTMYTQYTTDAAVNGGINARLVFGPFAHKYSTYADYWNWGRYVGNPWYGQNKGDMNKAFPGNHGNAATANSRWGMPYMPEYFGNDFRMFFLDDIDKNVLIVQGVNILGTDGKRSVLYSRRGVEIGGGLVKSTSSYNDLLGATTRDVNSHIRGISYGYAPTWPNYFAFTTRYSQIFYNTDIVLLQGPAGGASADRESFILDANLPDDGAYGDNVHTSPNSNNNFSDNENKKFSPTVRIIGGYIYVGDRHKLTISGGRTNPLNGINEETLTVSPASITVATGGALTINGSTGSNATTKPNVTTDIFASGAVTLGPGAKTKGNIIVGGSGAATLGDAAHCDGNIYVEAGGSLTIGRDAAVTGAIQVASGGALTVQEGAVITGDVRCAGDMRLEGSITLNYDPSRGAADNPATTDIDESIQVNGRYIYHGIFIYYGKNAGAGNLVVAGGSAVTGNSGGIHSFAGCPGISGTAADNVFCENHAANGNACRHWESSTGVWVKRGSSSNG